MRKQAGFTVYELLFGLGIVIWIGGAAITAFMGEAIIAAIIFVVGLLFIDARVALIVTIIIALFMFMTGNIPVSG